MTVDERLDQIEHMLERMLECLLVLQRLAILAEGRERPGPCVHPAAARPPAAPRRHRRRQAEVGHLP